MGKDRGRVLRGLAPGKEYDYAIVSGNFHPLTAEHVDTFRQIKGFSQCLFAIHTGDALSYEVKEYLESVLDSNMYVDVVDLDSREIGGTVIGLKQKDESALICWCTYNSKTSKDDEIFAGQLNIDIHLFGTGTESEITDDIGKNDSCGSFKELTRADKYIVNEITILPENTSHRFFHCHRSKSWSVVSGVGQYYYFDQNGTREKVELEQHTSMYIEQGTEHWITNTGKIPLVIIETCFGEYLGDDDAEIQLD